MSRGRQVLNPFRVDESTFNPIAFGAGGDLDAAVRDGSDATYVYFGSWANGVPAKIIYGISSIPITATERVRRGFATARIGKLNPGNTTYAEFQLSSTLSGSVPIHVPIPVSTGAIPANPTNVNTTTKTFKAGPDRLLDALSAPQVKIVQSGTADVNARMRIVETSLVLDVVAQPTFLSLTAVNDADANVAVVADATRPRMRMVTADGGNFTGTGSSPLPTVHEFRVFDAAEAPAAADAWTAGNALHTLTGTGSQVQDTTETITSAPLAEALANGDYVVFGRYGSTGWADGTYWSDTAEFAFTVAVPSPAPPTLVSADVIAAPPSVLVQVRHETYVAGEMWDAPTQVRVQVQRRVGADGAWEDLLSTDNGAIVVEGALALVLDRFMIRHDVASYRARMYGYSDLRPVVTDWSNTLTVGVGQWQDDVCDVWLIAPEGGEWSGSEDPSGWSRGRPYGPSQPLDGGLDRVLSGRPSGRRSTVTAVARSVADALAWEHVVDGTIVWYLPADPEVPGIWAAPGPDSSVGVVKVAGLHLVSVGLTEVAPEPQVLPPSIDPS